jgi:hypothetical protein
MNNSFLAELPELLIISVLFIFIIVSQWAGFKIQQSQLRGSVAVKDSLGSVEGSLLGLLALLLSFTFSMSASKNETRRQVIIEEANNIGTVILRSDLYSDKDRAYLKAALQQYLEARIAYYKAGTDSASIKAALLTSDIHSRVLWNYIAQLAQLNTNTLATQQMVPAFNAMNDIVVTPEAENNAHIPDSILWLLFL